MGCAGSAPVPPVKPETAEEAYSAAANPKVAGQMDANENLYGIEEGSREFILGQVKQCCNKLTNWCMP